MSTMAAEPQTPVSGADAGIEVSIAGAADERAWSAYVAGHPQATAYHQWPWRGVFERAFRQQCCYLVARTRAHAVCGVLPLVAFHSRLFGTFAVSLPFVNYGGVLADDEAVARRLVAEALSLARTRRWKHVELRHVEQQFQEWPVKRHKVTMRLALPPAAEALWEGLDRKVRNQVRKAEKTGCTVAHGGPERIDAFYRVFAHNMRDLGTPVYGRVFFEEVLRALPGDTRVFIVESDGTPIAGSIVVGFRERLEVPWASSLRAHSDKSPNMLLYRAMLEWGIARGYREFDFGRSTPNEGTFQFKKQWGARPTPLSWEYVGLAGAPPDQGPTNPKFRAAIAVWQRLPVKLATAIGPFIVRNIP